MTVVLSATGFQDLLNQLSFMQRVSKQDGMSSARSARPAARWPQATALGKLEVREQVLVADVLAQRNALARTSASLQQQRQAVAQFRNVKASELAGARAEVGRLQHELSQLQAEQAALARRDAAERSSGSSGSSGSAPAPAPARGLGSGVLGRLHVPAAQERRGAAECMVARPGRRHLRARQHARVRRVLGHDRAARHRRLRTVGAGAPLRWLNRRLQLRLLRPRRTARTNCRSAPTSAPAR